MSTAQSANVPLSVLQQLAPMAEEMGITLPGLARFAPVINATQSIRALALEVGRLVAGKNIFLKGDDVVTLDDETGEMRGMTSQRFTSWVEEFCTFISPGARRMRESLPVEDAAQILKSDIFIGCLRPLEDVYTMRLPTMRENGEIEFLEPGYDPQTKIFTVDLLKYAMDWTLEEGIEFLNAHGEEYPWSWPDDLPEAARHLMQNRSWAVQVLSMVGVYCRAMFPAGTTRPMVFIVGNQPGTGKTRLVEMALMPVYGHSSTSKTPKDDETMAKELETIARSYQPYVFFDDIGGGIFSNHLNRFITSSSHAGRVMGGNDRFFRVPNVSQVFSTGNAIKLSEDLMRRCLAMELFLPGEVRGRKFKKTITTKYLASLEVRSMFLSAMCALVKHYVGIDKPARLHRKPLESFEEWSGVIGALVQAAGYTDPLAAPQLSIGGSEDEDEMRELLIKIASEADGDRSFDRKELVEQARTLGLMEHLLGIDGDKEIDSATSKKLGRQLQKWRGRELTDSNGRKFRFGHQRQKRGAQYPLRFISSEGAR
jgi:hypothetical protein